jgi:tetratricopeptide (TPR) repeat protein
MKSITRLARLSILIFLLSYATSAQHEDFPRGQIIEKVICKQDATQSYALYLPSTYTASKKWPIIYCFDPRARGAFPLERFKEAAEKYGYIVAGSNNSRNGPDVPLSNIVRTWFQDTSIRLAIDDRRVYAAGFSGGARVACSVGHSYQGGIHGVIACGAGFPPQLMPSRSTPFVLFGTIGSEDFNYSEMKELDETLDSVGITHRIEVFEGGHDWASAEMCRAAVEWMEIQAMKSSRRLKDENLIGELFEKASHTAQSLESANRKYDAYLAYNALLDFKGLRDVQEFEKKSKELKESKEVKQALKEDREQVAEQKRRMTEIYMLRTKLRNSGEATLTGEAPAAQTQSNNPNSSISDVRGPTVYDSDPRHLIASDIKKRLNDLRKKATAKEASPERATARRILNQYMAYSFETTQIFFLSKKYDLAISHLSVEAEIQPDNPRLFYNLACAYSLYGDKKKALEALKKAVQKGYNNIAELNASEALAPLRQEESFQKIIEQIRGQ